MRADALKDPAAEFSPIRMSGTIGWILMILGVGALITNSICPWLLQIVYTTDGVTDFKSMFMIPMTISILAALLLAFGFRPPTEVNGDDNVA